MAKKKKGKSNRKRVDKAPSVSVEYPSQDGTFFFIAGYTDWGFPYGITWEENEQMNNDDSLFRTMPPEAEDLDIRRVIAMRKLMDELIDAYLDNSFEHPYLLDLQTGEVILDMDEMYTGEPGIDWEDEENEDRYEAVPKIDSNEAYNVMMRFAKHTDSDPEMKLFDALEGNKPFRRFKDRLTQLDIWEEWDSFERQHAEGVIMSWMERNKLDYEELAERHKVFNSK